MTRLPYIAPALTRLPSVEIYEARRGLALRKQWRWRVRAANGRIISMSSEGYNNRADLMRGIEITAQAIRQESPAPRA